MTSAGESFVDYVQQYERVVRTPAVDSDKLFDATNRVLTGVHKECSKAGSLFQRGNTDAVIEHWYTRLAAALTLYITNPSVTLNMDQLSTVCKHKQAVAYIFSAAGYRGMGHLIPQMVNERQGETRLELDRLAVLLAFISLDDLPPDLLTLALKQKPRLLLTLMLGWLNTRAVLTARGEANRARLLLSGALIEDAEIGDRDIAEVVNAWMYSSYASVETKHEIKKSFNHLLRKLIDFPLPSVAKQRRAKSRKPRVVVALERFTHVHAMYRCYAPSLNGLKPRFELIALVEEQNIDDIASGLFDQVIRISKGQKRLHEIVSSVIELAPDIIYYPSLGMCHWTVLMAQLRLAPIQLMSHGHPATSMSPAIDYAYVCEMDGDLGAIHSEKVLVGNEYAVFEPHSELPRPLPELLAPSDREVAIAVNSKVMKISSRLLAVCKKLSDNAPIPIRFYFFPGEQGLFYDGLRAAIKAQLPNAEVEPYSSYVGFMEKLARCDFALAAFPFGNTNSTIDTCLLGLPTVSHFGPEGPAQSDRLVLHTAGFADWLVCKSDEEYYTTALSLITHPEKRKAALNGLTREEIAENLFSSSKNKSANPFSEVIWHMYNHHASLQASPERVFTYRSLLNG